MNKEVSFELAKLLKEKGFESESKAFYDGSGELFYYSYSNNAMQRFRYAAPTIAEVVMWLYEKHGIWIEVVWDIELNKELKWYSGVTNIGDSSELEIFQSNPCDTPTEAYEAAIEYCLTNLI